MSYKILSTLIKAGTLLILHSQQTQHAPYSAILLGHVEYGMVSLADKALKTSTRACFRVWWWWLMCRGRPSVSRKVDTRGPAHGFSNIRIIEDTIKSPRTSIHARSRGWLDGTKQPPSKRAYMLVLDRGWMVAMKNEQPPSKTSRHSRFWWRTGRTNLRDGPYSSCQSETVPPWLSSD